MVRRLAGSRGSVREVLLLDTSAEMLERAQTLLEVLTPFTPLRDPHSPSKPGYPGYPIHFYQLAVLLSLAAIGPAACVWWELYDSAWIRVQQPDRLSDPRSRYQMGKCATHCVHVWPSRRRHEPRGWICRRWVSCFAVVKQSINEVVR